jgi:hypothetical protein
MRKERGGSSYMLNTPMKSNRVEWVGQQLPVLEVELGAQVDYKALI